MVRTANPQGRDLDGTGYRHEITFDNGFSGIYISRAKTQESFVPGQQASYSILQSNSGETRIRPT